MAGRTMAILARRPGGPEVLEWADVDTPDPGPGEVLVRQTAIGVNFLDTYYRSGLYPWPETPMIPGGEAAGVVEAVGEGVTSLRAGERVAYTTPYGAYRRQRVLPANRLVKVPDVVSDAVVASTMLKGLTVQYLVTSTFAVQRGHLVLVHAAAGGVGLLMGPWLKAIGAVAIGTVGSERKAALARAAGYNEVIDYTREDFAARVAEITSGSLCDVVYDSVGKDTWRGSLKSLKRRGMFVSFGQSSGMIEGFRLADLAANGSLSASRPVLFDYIVNPAELAARSADLFEKVAAGTLRVTPGAMLPLREAAEAHRALEARETSGSTILIV
jgi:NADPH2:quinone reductase